MKLLDDALYVIVGGALVVGLVAGVYYAGKHAGENKVNLAWTQEKKKLGDQIIKLQEDLRDSLAAYRIASDEHDKKLKQAKADYEKSLSSIRSDHALRLQHSNKRADVYQRMSEGAESERRSLASHAAQLDRSLEEGRLVVGELQATIRQRDAELILLGSQLLTERKLINASSATSTNAD